MYGEPFLSLMVCEAQSEKVCLISVMSGPVVTSAGAAVSAVRGTEGKPQAESDPWWLQAPLLNEGN